MSDPATSSPARPALLALLARIFSRKTFVRLAFAFAALITLFFAFIAIENRRGDRAWAAYCAEADQRGVPYRRETFLPPPIPDAQNFAAIPVFQEIFAAVEAKKTNPEPLKWNQEVPQADIAVLPNRLKGERMDYATWQKAFKAGGQLPQTTDDPVRDTLTGIASFDPILKQLHDAASRPHCRFPIKWEDGIMAQLPHLGTLRGAARFDAARMIAHLSLSDSPAALTDWRDGFALFRALEKEPVLVSGLVRIAILRQMEDAMWQGLTAHQWKEPELRAIMADLASLDLLADCRFGLASERCGTNGVIDDVMAMSTRERRQLFGAAMGTEGESGNVGGLWGQLFYPRGWFRQSQIKINELFDRRLAEIDPAHGRYALGFNTDEQLLAIRNGGFLDRSRYMLASLLMPALGTVEGSYAVAHATAQQARLACALELFHLAQNAFPARLEELVPAFLEAIPKDAMDGAPMRYRRTADGFELWSIGLNREDDGGISEPPKNLRDQPDWVWRS